MREKVFPSSELAVPLEEFSRAIARIPRMIRPLVAEITTNQLLLSASERVRNSSIPDDMTIDDVLLDGAGAPRSAARRRT
jgi:hypothetical protein